MTDRGRWSYSSGFVVCVVFGLVLGVVFSIAGFLMYLVRGGAQPDWFDVGIGTSIVWYLASFGFAGLVAAVLNPLGRTKWEQSRSASSALFPLLSPPLTCCTVLSISETTSSRSSCIQSCLEVPLGSSRGRNSLAYGFDDSRHVDVAGRRGV
jgi:hypothetical protein